MSALLFEGRQIVAYNNYFILAVIANQSADWCGNPPVEWYQVAITTKNRSISRSVGQLSIHFLSNRGIATEVLRTGSQ